MTQADRPICRTLRLTLLQSEVSTLSLQALIRDMTPVCTRQVQFKTDLSPRELRHLTIAARVARGARDPWGVVAFADQTHGHVGEGDR
jgi:hypothetical protein